MNREELFKQMMEEQNWQIYFEGAYIRTKTTVIMLHRVCPHFDFLNDFYRSCLQKFYDLSLNQIQTELKKMFTYTKEVEISYCPNGEKKENITEEKEVFDKGNYELAFYRRHQKLKEECEKERQAFSKLMLDKLIKEPTFLVHPLISNLFSQYLRKAENEAIR